jgi:cytochrome c-type biogenesis protein CcmH/NrfF
MEMIMVSVIAIAVFGALFAALAMRDYRNRKRPPVHTCHQGHCQCQNGSVQDSSTPCEKKMQRCTVDASVSRQNSP